MSFRRVRYQPLGQAPMALLDNDDDDGDDDNDNNTGEQEEEDSDLEASLLDPDDPHTFNLHQGTTNDQHRPHSGVDGDPQRGLISPYKRLRLDQSCISLQSQGGEEEAHSLIRSMDSVDSHPAHRSLMFNSVDCYSSLEDAGSLCSQGNTSTNTNNTHSTTSSLAIQDVLSSSHSNPSNNHTRKSHAQIPTCPKTTTPSNYELCLKEDDPFLSADEKEFPGPPRLDKSKERSSHSALSADLDLPSLNGSSERESATESGSNPRSSYHPDYQVLEVSKKIAYHPPQMICQEGSRERTLSKVSSSTTLKAHSDSREGSSSTLKNEFGVANGEAEGMVEVNGLQPSSSAPSEACVEMLEIHASQEASSLALSDNSQQKRQQISFENNTNSEDKNIVVDNGISRNYYLSQHPLYQNIPTAQYSCSNNSPEAVTQSIDQYFRERSGVLLNNNTRLGGSPKTDSFESETRTRRVDIDEINPHASYVEMSPPPFGIGVSTNAMQSLAPPFLPTPSLLPPSITAAPSSETRTSSSNLPTAPSPSPSHDGSGSRIYEILDSDSSDFRVMEVMGHRSTEVKTTVSSGVSTDDLKPSYAGPGPGYLDFMLMDDRIVAGARQEFSRGHQKHRHDHQHHPHYNSGGHATDYANTHATTTTTTTTTTTNNNDDDIQYHNHHHHHHQYNSTSGRPGSTATRSSSRTTLGSAGMLSSQSDGSSRNVRGRRERRDDRARMQYSSGSQGSQGSRHSGATTSSSWYMTTASSSSQDNPYGDVSEDRCYPDRKPKKAVLQSAGLLKIAAYMNVGLLTVNIIKAKHLSSAWSQHCDAYVKMSLVPDETRRTRCKTKQIPSTNSPIFEEKFSIEILDEDRRKRLLISVWHKDEHNGASEFLGCMSFGVPHLLKKDLDGWYYLLTEEVGRKKHLQARGTHTATKKPVLTTRGPPNVPIPNLSVEGQEKTVITVQRGKNGFGFSFIDELPPKIGRVDKASPAEQAGIRKGDSVISINGKNVSRSTSKGVAHLVKQMKAKTLTLELQRDPTTTTNTASSTASTASTTVKRSVGTSSTSTSTSHNNTDHLYESILAGGSSNPTAIHHKENRRAGPGINENLDEDDGYSQTYGNDDYYNDSRSHHRGSIPNLKALTSTPMPRPAPKHRPASTQIVNRDRQESVHRLMSIELDFIDFMHYGIERYSRPLRHCIISTQQHGTMFQNVEKLVTISEFHIKQLQENAPSSVNSEDTDDSQSSENSSMFPNSVALIYQSKIHMLCQAYESYAHGLTHSNQLLRQLRSNADFVQFIKDPASNTGGSMFGYPSISAFINRPVQHINDLYTVVSEIFAATSPQSADYPVLQKISTKLAHCITAITDLSSRGRVYSLDSLTSSQGCSTSQTTSSDKGSMASLTSCSSAESEALRGDGFMLPPPPPSNTATTSASSLPSSASAMAAAATAHQRPVDQEVARIQDRLVFPPHIPTFQLCQEDRHIIFQGDIYWLDQGSWFKSHLLLLSDLLLLLDQEANGTLRVVDTPYFLSDLSGLEVNRKHASEFVLHLHTTTPFSTNLHAKKHNQHPNTKPIILRAPSAQEKFMWKSLLEQRVSSVSGNKLQHYGSMRDISNVKTSVVL